LGEAAAHVETRYRLVLGALGKAKISISIVIGLNKRKRQGEASMIRLITRGRFTQDYAQRLLAAPEDREPAVRKLIEAAGGKVISFYFTTGGADFQLVTEADEAESIIAALMAVAAAGMISDVTTSRAWTGSEFKAVASKASKVARAYRVPGKK
jgi:uncharacterized protein with GYD domain